MLLCPNCNHRLSSKTIRTSSSGTIDVDTCEACGGVYFDRGEVNRIPRDEAAKLIHENPHLNPDVKKGSHHCPKCGASLERYWGESVPNDVYVLRCPACHGAWFQEQDLQKFKKAQETKIEYFKTWKIPLPSLSSVMLPVALFIVLSGTLWITVDQVQENQELRTFAREILTTPSVIPDQELSRATIIFTTKQPARTQIDYYEKYGEAMTLVISSEPSTTHLVTLPNLTPGTEYFYRIHVVTGEEDFMSPEYSFEF